MKRAYVDVQKAGEVEEWDEDCGGSNCKSVCHNTAKDIKPPPGIISKKLPSKVMVLVNDMTPVDGTNKFLFFLGAQGKEYINDIESRFSDAGWSIPLFVSANIERSGRAHGADFYSTNDQCRALGNYFGIMDPLGGGLYPLHYLLVIDKHDMLRCKVPIQVNRWVAPQERFGVNIRDLDALVEAYAMYLGQR